MKNRTVWATDPKYYTILYRSKGSRRFHRCGYRSNNLEDLRSMAYNEIGSGKYAAAKIVKWDTEELIEDIR